ncbi:tetratricopeptide repeat protein (macronuclear) [Tetrahymena thermophila SB210]|uniref:Tetratricopeptide repeat protein n=1 Tax=Tetrahymena thermophila (strain SB210) TaxID=312017 RepID=Q24HU8_TETTS|nr:tetratricopeptide repeat protein [Tetrahymena thermophila SB210]EAS07339.3 tetratricopeptide repeat protein [Tetrahymena thermophila SB210]|eukprot:XP_001027581.3 tetratricopeptide repeat protein [Tetrahymena thermophila SB210]
MDLCLQQKQQFSDQINKTIEYIKTGNYSIENQTSLSQLYYQWERFGQKQVSIVLPIQSNFKGNNNQEPYSFAIILVGRVIADNSDQFKLFNIISTSLIKMFLLIEFGLICSIIIIFIINYGLFQVYSIKMPIEILIEFLKKSYQEQQKNSIKYNQYKQSNQKIKTLAQKKAARKKQKSIYKNVIQANQNKSNQIWKNSQNESQNQTQILNKNLQKNIFEEESFKQSENDGKDYFIFDKIKENNSPDLIMDNYQ